MFPLSRIVDRAAALYGREPAVCDDAVRLSYAELTRRVTALAGGLLIAPEPLPKSGPGKIAKALLRAPFWEKRS